jgi:hypothetical protein
MSEHIAKVATSVIDGLRQQPLILALVLMQALILAAVLYSTVHRQEATTAQFTAIFELLKTCMNK